MRPGSKRQWRVYGTSIRFAIVLGAVYGVAVGAATLKPPLRVYAVAAR